jgi:hypothetical protein
MKDLTLIIIGNNDDTKEDKNIEVFYTKGNNIKELIKIARGKYITFIKEEDKLSKDYLRLVLEKTKKEFDYCFVNYIIEYDYKRDVNLSVNEPELANNKPYYGEYLFSYIFNTKKLQSIIDINDVKTFNEKINSDFTKKDAIGTLIYYHNPKGSRNIKDFVYCDLKRNEYYKNMIYVGGGCAGLFNGYVSWLKNIGRCFGKKYQITFLYDAMEKTVNSYLSKFGKCVKRETGINYYTDRLLVTYSTYYYPKNIITLDQSYMFIHGNMSDYPNTRVFHDDLYTHYVAVSKVSAKKAEGYFPTKKIEYITNPFKLEKDLVKPHLTLTSAFKYSSVKKPERVELMASILDELEIPYTWNFFTDQKENTCHNGLIYRQRVANPIPYVKDSDYFVHLSDSEAMPYCVMEAVSVNTKVIVTPLEAYDELGIVNGKNGFIVPFNYFEEKNRKKLVSFVKKIYKEKEKKVRFKLKESLWDGYNDIFIK